MLGCVAAPPLHDGALHALRQALIFDCCKWDPQVEDVASPAAAPLLLSPNTWQQLARDAESLSREILAAEDELAHRPDLHRQLGLPFPIRRVLRHAARQTPHRRNDVRCIRFDFHPTADGWRISEANTDVPGGFIEATGMNRLFAAHYANTTVAGDPTETLADGVAARLSPHSTVALVHATAYSDDRQVMVFLANALKARHLQPVLISPAQLRWRDGQAIIDCDWHRGPADMLLRFFPAEWLCNLERAAGWRNWFMPGVTPMCNPGTALLTQSKRLPLIWDKLATPMDTWRRLLPTTADPRQVAWRNDPQWILKPALGRVGEALGMVGQTEAKLLRRIQRDARWHPRDWIVQQRFDAVAMATAEGPRYPCFGVYVIDGRAAGVYGRIADRPLIDSRAQDVAVLLASAMIDDTPDPTWATQSSNIQARQSQEVAR